MKEIEFKLTTVIISILGVIGILSIILGNLNPPNTLTLFFVLSISLLIMIAIILYFKIPPYLYSAIQLDKILIIKPKKQFLSSLVICGIVFGWIIGIMSIFLGIFLYVLNFVSPSSRYLSYEVNLLLFSGLLFGLSGILIIIIAIFMQIKRFEDSIKLTKIAFITTTIAIIIAFYIITDRGTNHPTACLGILLPIAIVILLMGYASIKSKKMDKEEEDKQKITKEEFLKLLDERLVKGDISEETYKELRKKYEEQKEA